VGRALKTHHGPVFWFLLVEKRADCCPNRSGRQDGVRKRDNAVFVLKEDDAVYDSLGDWI